MCGTPFYALEIAVNEKGPGPKGLPGGKEETDRLLLFTMFGAGNLSHKMLPHCF